MERYLIGYGSLINPDERERIGLARDVAIVRVHGYARKWNVQASNKKTYLGVVPDPSSSLNAVLVPVTETQLHQLDERERAYDRVEVRSGQWTVDGGLRTVTNSSLFADRGSLVKMWIYVPKAEWRSEVATPACAVKRRYVDTVIAGYLYYGDGFATEFVATTSLWEQYWFENRTAPQQLREQIDALVGQYYPRATQVLTRLSPSPRPAG